MKVPQLVKPQSRFERVGFWIIVAAAAVVLVALAGFVIGPVWAALGTGIIVGLFAALITALNLSNVAGPANRVLGRKVFPVVSVGDRAVSRLVAANGILMFVAAFLFEWLRTALHLGSIFSGIAVLILVGVAGTVVSRARNAVEKRPTATLTTVDAQVINRDTRERVA